MSDFTAQPPPLPPADHGFEGVVPPRPHFWREHRITIVVAAVMSALVTVVMGAVVFALIVLFSPPSTREGKQRASGTLVQEGTAIIRSEPVEVYYPVPYSGPPNLSLNGSMSTHCILLEQKPDHFKAKLADPWGNNPSSVSWKAEGRPGAGEHK